MKHRKCTQPTSSACQSESISTIYRQINHLLFRSFALASTVHNYFFIISFCVTRLVYSCIQKLIYFLTTEKESKEYDTMMISLNKSTVLLLSTYTLSATAFSAVEAKATGAQLGTVWNEVPEGPPDAILGIAQAFRASPEEHKVNVCVGAYRDTKGLPWVLPSVKKAEEIMLADGKENKEYLPIDGDQAYVEKALKFAYGAEAPLDRIAGVQTLSGTGACRIGGQFLADFYPNKNIFVPDRTSG